MIQRWRPDVSAGCGPVPFHWPEPTILYADTTTMCRLHRVSPAGLWQRIERHELAAPEVWVDGKPGWPIR
ncbi:hypothetical protein [Nocardia concava]|uniref:hypothetical protein n=1 Tax=Nocardia concava TaxID=257281 RepID=UPI00031736F8|nr:hypothetical protein [Nocardia concava]